MHVNFRTRQLQRCYESHKEAARQWGAAVARRYIERVGVLYATETVDDLYRIPPLRFHPLKGARRGQYALWLTDRARLIVSFAGRAKQTVWVEEVSQHYDD